MNTTQQSVRTYTIKTPLEYALYVNDYLFKKKYLLARVSVHKFSVLRMVDKKS